MKSRIVQDETENKDRAEGPRTPSAEPPKRVFTATRIVALVVIAILVACLAYLRFGAGDDEVSVPAGAQAGDLSLEPCDFSTEDGSYEADCGTLVVPENRADPESRLIALPVTRIRARSANPGAPIFRLQGGPGITNTEFPEASRFAAEQDVVLVGYRGVDGSAILDCPEVESALKRSEDFLADESLRDYGDAFTECASRLEEDDGFDLAGYTLPERVDDLEDARVALGYDRIDLVSESAGTRTAMIYAWRYPQSIHRSVMIGANPPGHFVWDSRTTDELLHRYSDLCAQDETCSDRTEDLAASIRHNADDVPDDFLFSPISEGNVRLASFWGLMEPTSENAPLSAQMTLDAWLAADDGDASGFWIQSLLADLTFPESFVWGELAATAHLDASQAEEYFSSPDADTGSILGNPGAHFVWGGGRLVEAWPDAPGDDDYTEVRSSNVETLLIGGTLDFATPPQWARDDLLPHLPNGHQVVLAELGHTTDFWSYRPDASTRLVTAFLDDGRVDDSGYGHRPMEFSTEVTQTALGKGFLGAMIGFSLLTLISLVWLPLRVRKRGAIGSKASAALRSVYPLVLGLGGWFGAVLIVMTAWPTLPLDNEVMAVLSIGLPIGLGIFWAWVHRDWTREAKRFEVVAAIGAALLGAWLGFHSATGLLALITAIVGAGVAANLTLIMRDISRERTVRDHVALDASARPVSAKPA
jgi:pimeloyl-ACP methyl ester carboxylesterase